MAGSSWNEWRKGHPSRRGASTPGPGRPAPHLSGKPRASRRPESVPHPRASRRPASVPQLRGTSRRPAPRATASALVGAPRAALAAVVLAIVLIVVVVRAISSCAAKPAPEPAQTDRPATTAPAYDASVSTVLLDEGRTTGSGDGRMSFSAVGDNLANENLLELADRWAGSAGDGAYDFSPFYTEVKPIIQGSYDVSFINQETVLGGTGRFGYMGYPSYNTPDSMADAVADAGWRVVNIDSNHTYDIWTAGIEHNQGVWAQKRGLVTVGSYASESDRQTVRVVECNGIRMAVLGYSYGQNAYEQSDLPNDYYAVAWDEAKAREDIDRARKVADVVVVYMHWGKEYDNAPTETQRAQAQVLADAGVDLVIGSHAHVIQPVEWLGRKDGGRMPVAYGLGDFVSGYRNHPDTIMSGMLSCDFVRVAADARGADNVGPGGIAVENLTWHPLVEHMALGTDVVRLVKGYSDEDARANELLAGLDDPRGWLESKTREVVGDQVALDL